MKSLLPFIILLAFTNALFAQQKDKNLRFNPCGTQSPSEEWNEWFSEQVKEFKRNQANNRTPLVNYKIPIIIHIIHNGDPVGVNENISLAQAHSQIPLLNADFSGQNCDISLVPAEFLSALAHDTGIQFCLASHMPDGTPLLELGVERINWKNKNWQDPNTLTKETYEDYFDNTIKPHSLSIWDPKRYLNVWLADISNSRIAGYAKLPRGSQYLFFNNVENQNTAGVVLNHKYWGNLGSVLTNDVENFPLYNKGRAATHEIGHYLGLLHTFNDECSGENPASCYLAGDYCCDTPPTIYKDWACPSNSINTCKNILFDIGNDMTMNFMAYTDDFCRFMFTKDQVDRMQTVMSTGTYRRNLGSNVNCNPICSDIYESNNSVGSAKNVYNTPVLQTSFSSIIKGNIGYLDDVDWHKVTIGSSGKLTVKLSNLIYNYNIELYNSTGTGFLKGGYSAGIKNEEISFTYSGSNIAYIKIYAPDPCNYTSDYCYDLQFFWEPTPQCTPLATNNRCSDAFPITPSATCSYVNGTTCGANPSNPTTGLQTCTLTPSASNDVWYKFVATSSTATFNVKSGTDFDAVVQIFSIVTCGSAYTQLACINNTGVLGTESITLNNLSTNNTYYIRIFNNTSLSGTDFQICVVSQTSCTAPPNNECAGAISLTPSSSLNYQTYNTNCATQSIAALSSCNGFLAGNADDDVWFKFSAIAGQAYTIRLLNGTGFDGVLDLRTGNCNGSNVLCADQPGTTGVLNTINYTSTTNQTVLLRVYHYGPGSGTGNFEISVVTTSAGCSKPVPPILNPPTAITSSSVSMSWNNVGAASYNVYYTTGSCPWISGTFSSNTTNTSTTVPGLSPGLTYKFIVMAKNSETCISDNSNCQSAVTSTACTISGIIPTLITPGSATGPGPTLTTTTPTLSWNAVSGATHYGVNIRDLSTNMLVVDENCTTSGLSYTVPLGILNNNGQYRWNIKAVTNCGSNCVSGFASPLYFNISVSGGCTTPTIPLLTLSNITSTSVYLSWNNVGAQSYDVYYSSGSCPWTSGTVYTNTTNNFVTVINLSPGVPYKFVVVAKNSTTCYSQNSNCQSAVTSNTSFFVSTSSNPVSGGTTSGGGTYSSGQNATIVATSNPGYSFINWTENGSHYSSNATHLLNVSYNRNFVANFSSCNYTINSNSVSAVAQGGIYAFWLFTSPDCNWNAFADNCSGMVNLLNPTGVGNGFVQFEVLPNPNATTRSCTISVSGQSFTVIQVGTISPCSITPVTPNNLSGYVDGSNKLHLSWTGNNTGVSNFEIERSLNISGPFLPIGTSGQTFGYNDATVIGGTTYFYRARACCGSNCSDYSNIASLNACTFSLPITGILPSLIEICQGESVTLTVQGGQIGTGASMTWRDQSNFAQIVGTGNSITVSPNATKTYLVKPEGSDCAEYMPFVPYSMVTVTVNESPSSPPNPINTDAQCGNATISKLGEPTSGVQWFWQDNSCGTLNTNSSPTYTAMTSGTYYLRALNTNNNCWSADCGKIDISLENGQLNDECIGAKSIPFNTDCNPTIHSSCGASASNFISCYGDQDDDVFFSFVPTTSTATINVESLSEYDAVFEVLTSPCSDLMIPVSDGCVNNTGTNGVESITLDGLSIGSVYFIRVWHFGTGYGSTGAFTVCVHEDCTTPAAPIDVSGFEFDQSIAYLTWNSDNPIGSQPVTYYWVIGTNPSVTYGNGVDQGSTLNTTVSSNLLIPDTDYYLRVFAHTSCDNTFSEYGTSSPFSLSSYCITPGTPTNITASVSDDNITTLAWSPGNPTGSPNVRYNWVVGTDPAVAYGGGITQGTTSNTGVSTNLIPPGGTYYLRVSAYTDCDDSSSEYGTSAAFNTVPCITPGAPVNVQALATGNTTASLTWQAGIPKGAPRILYYWVIGTSPSVTYGQGVAFGITNLTQVETSDLSEGTTYYLRVYATSDCNDILSPYGTSAAFTTNRNDNCITPGIPVSVNVIPTGQNTANLSWTSGAPSGSPDLTYFWVIGTSPNVTYGNGLDQGFSNSTSATTSSLSCNTTYYLRVYTRTNCDNSISGYGTSTAFTTSACSCITPGTPVSVNVIPTGQNTANLSWASGTPSGSTAITYFWVIGSSPNVTYGSGVDQGFSSGTSATTSSLSCNTIYYLRVYARTNCDNSISGYGTSIAFTTSSCSCITPGTPLSVNAIPTGHNTANLSWVAGNPVGSPTVTYFWVIGSNPNVTYGNGVDQGSTNWTSATTSSLLCNTTYYLRVYAKTNCDNSTSGYGTSIAFTTSACSCNTPSNPVNVNASVTVQNSANIFWNSGNPAGSPTVTYYWVVGTSASVLYGNGVAQGSTTGFGTTATGLLPGTTYYLRVYARTSCNNSSSGYGTSIAFTTNNGSCITPSAQSSTISFSLLGTQQFTANWVNGNGSRRIVKINTVNNFSPPANGTDPLANSKFVGNGDQVVYNGNGNSVTITGLYPNTTYWIRVYEANCSGSSSFYNTSPGTNNPISQRTRTVLPSVQSFSASNVTFNGNNIVDINPIFFTNQPYATHPPIDIFLQGNNKTRFTLNASYAEGFSFQLVDQLTIVTDGTMAISPQTYGRLSPVISTYVNSMYMDYTHPEYVNVNPYLSLKIRLLFEGGLVGMDIPVHIHAPQGALPVELVDFQAQYNIHADINELSWITKSEVNNDYFDIERSFESFTFENIGRVAGSGNSSTSIDYVFNDKNISQDGNYTYRLKQVDLNGGETFSKPASVKVFRLKSIKTGLFPNPASDLINCFVEAHESAIVNIDIFNSLGQKVSRNINPEIKGNMGLIRQIDSKDFGKGIFTVVFSIDGIRYNHKLIIID